MPRSRPRAQRPAHRGRAAGFTLIEAMIAMVVLSVGVLGILSMQTASVGAVSASQDLTHAVNIGSRMVELLRVDALRWTSTTALSTSTLLLSRALPASQTTGAQGNWTAIPDNVIVPSMQGRKVDRNFIPDTRGSPDWPIGFRYCVHYRLTWVTPPVALRADVRVSWPKDEGIRSLLTDCIADVQNAEDLANVRTTNLSTTITVNPL